MVMQQADSNFFQRYGQRIAQAHAQHKDKPVDTGIMRLPPGIDGGIAKLQVLEVRTQDKETGKVPKGEKYLFAQAIVLSPQEVKGRRVAGLHTFQYIPLCDIPAKGLRKAVSFNDNWNAYQNMFKLLSNNTIVCQETPQTDPTGQKTWAFYIAAAASLTDPKRPGGPVHIEFSTRGWTPPATQLQPNPEELVFETWHGLASAAALAPLNGQLTHNPSTGVNVIESPPVMGADDLPLVGQQSENPNDPGDLEVEIAQLVAIANNDPEGETEEGQAAMMRLQEMAMEGGWSEDQIREATWDQVGDMAKWGPSEDDHINEQSPVTVGSKWHFAKRDKNGAKLKNKEGHELPPVEVEVVSVDEENSTCTVKGVKDGRTLINIGTKKPIVVKFQWLEWLK